RNVVSIRRKRARRGKFDSSDTMRKNLQYGGVPFRIIFDRKRKEKPQVMVLCDVSDSVRNVSRFMLQFVYSLQDLYSKVRSFIFVAEVGEITRLFQERAKQVIWLNPENKMTWGFGDSEMDRYAPYCTLVEECRNLNQLYHVIDRLVAV